MNILPAFPLVKTNDIPDFYSIIFQVQATVSTLSIAVIALISGLVTKSHYGISLTDYVMNRKPKILKYRVLLIWALGLIIVNTLFLSLGYYNLIIPVLLSSVLISIKLTLNVFYVYQKGGNLKNEIFDYIEQCKYHKPDKIRSILYSLVSDCESAVLTDNFSVVREDLELILNLFDALIVGSEKREIDISMMREDYEYKEVYSLIQKTLGLYNERYFELITDIIRQVYDLFNKRYMQCNTWGEISDEYYSVLSLINPARILNTEKICSLRLALYGNVTQDPRTWSVSRFLPSLYSTFTINMHYPSVSSSIRNDFWSKMLENYYKISDHSCISTNRFKVEPLKKEYINFFFKLIENDDIDLLSRLFIPVNQSFIEEVFVITANIYEKSINHGEIMTRIAYIRMLNNRAYKLTSLNIKPSIESVKRNCIAIGKYKGFNLESCNYKKYCVGSYIFEFILFYILTNLKSLSKEKIEELFDWFLKEPVDREDAIEILDYECEAKFEKKYGEFHELLLGASVHKESFKAHLYEVVLFVNYYFAKYKTDNRLLND